MQRLHCSIDSNSALLGLHRGLAGYGEAGQCYPGHTDQYPTGGEN